MHSNKLEVNINTPEERDAAIKRLQEMSFDREVKSWEDLGTIGGWYVNHASKVSRISEVGAFPNDEKIWNTEEQAKASIAMAQLSQLMKFYNDGWTPDWTEDSYKSVIVYRNGESVPSTSRWTSFFLTFKTEKITDKFLENHRDLIEQAKPLL